MPSIHWFTPQWLLQSRLAKAGAERFLDENFHGVLGRKHLIHFPLYSLDTLAESWIEGGAARTGGRMGYCHHGQRFISCAPMLSSPISFNLLIHQITSNILNTSNSRKLGAPALWDYSPTLGKVRDQSWARKGVKQQKQTTPLIMSFSI